MIPPAAAFFNLIRNYNPLTEVTMPALKQVFGGYGNTVLNQFKRYYKAKNAPNPVQALGDFFAQIDSELASIQDPGIVSGWVNFFKYQGPQVKNAAIKKLGSPKFLNRSFPSSINDKITPENIYSENVQPNVVTPDSPVPRMINAGMELPGYIVSNLAIAGKVLGDIFDSNIQIGLGKLGSPDQPHQGNLVADVKHLERIAGAATKFLDKAVKSFGAAANFAAQNLGFNKFGTGNKNVSSPNYRLTKSMTSQQQIQINSVGIPQTKDVNNINKLKPKPQRN